MSRVLLVEDEPWLQVLFRKTLERVGHHVSVATRGKEALSQCHVQPRDTVIVDLPLPDGDGLALITMLRRDYPAMSIVALSGDDHANKLLQFATSCGADQTFVKPVAMDELLTAVQGRLDGTGHDPIRPDAA